MTKLQMRRRAILAAAPALVAAPYVARAQTGKPEKPKVVLAVGGKSALYYLSLTIAETKGFFKDAGLDVEINDFQGGAKSLRGPDGRQRRRGGRRLRAHDSHAAARPAHQGLRPDRPRHAARHRPAQRRRREGQGTGRYQGHEVRRHGAGLADPHAGQQLGGQGRPEGHRHRGRSASAPAPRWWPRSRTSRSTASRRPIPRSPSCRRRT